MKFCFRITCLFFISFFISTISHSQDNPFKDNWRLNPKKIHIGTDQSVRQRTPYVTIKDWRKAIDSTWGFGLPTSQKLQIFDTFWNNADQQYGGFPNLTVNWDSMKTLYRPEIESGVSKGRFSAIMARLMYALQEVHTYVIDQSVDSSFYIPNVGWWTVQGVPTFAPGTGYGFSTIGAAVSPMPDSTGIIYRVQEGNPLKLKPGDRILGYNGKGWGSILRMFDSVQMPYSTGMMGSHIESKTYMFQNSIGVSWYLFDTMDVERYPSGLVEHLPTQPLADAGVGWDSMFCSDQIPVPGIRMPDILNGENCTWGIVQGTTIGYIYACDWSTVSTKFSQAVSELKNKTTGLILDFRFNTGGSSSQANGGFAQLFNENINLNYEVVVRSSTTNHFLFTHAPIGGFTPGIEVYQHPIAVLLGPACMSAGDYNAFRMRFHPMARSFGKRTNTGYVNGTYSQGTLVTSPWKYRFPKGGVYSKYNNEGFLIHKGFPVDEDVWFTQEGAAKQEDDVVKRALQWINTVPYAYSLQFNKLSFNPNGDSVTCTVIVNNNLSHSLVVSLLSSDLNGSLNDSVQFFNDGLHDDALANDSIWGTTIKTSPLINIYKFSLRTDDMTNGTFRKITDVRYLTSTGPVGIEMFRIASTDTIPSPGDLIMYNLTLKNIGSVAAVPNVTAKVKSGDSSIFTGDRILNYADLAPGASLNRVLPIQFTEKTPVSNPVRLTIEISSNYLPLWKYDIPIKITGVNAHELNYPTTFILQQNYPNPFNPSTTIRYALPSSAKVKLTIHDVLGREVTTLVNEEQSAGWKEVQWNASNFASGMYLVRMQTGSFVETKKILLMK
ncbi:MAG: S41 family peptidase [Bacteroidota bacterium]